MLDDLREGTSTGPFFEEEIAPPLEDMTVSRRSSRLLMGMTPVQRFILSLMLLMTICTLGSMFLLITGKILPPFLY